jgi:L-lactate dehydrogenase complex protein LldG
MNAREQILTRAVNFIAGPSRTGEIEQTIVPGAHGPCRVHLILCGETS